MRSMGVPFSEGSVPASAAASELSELLHATDSVLLQLHVYVARLAVALRHEGGLTSLQRRDTMRLTHNLAPLLHSAGALLSSTAAPARALALRGHGRSSRHAPAAAAAADGASAVAPGDEVDILTSIQSDVTRTTDHIPIDNHIATSATRFDKNITTSSSGYTHTITTTINRQ